MKTRKRRGVRHCQISDEIIDIFSYANMIVAIADKTSDKDVELWCSGVVVGSLDS